MANLADQRLLALIVDRYLNDNNFSNTRNTFRNEAPFLFNDSPNTNQISMNMMGLDEILNEFKGLNELMIQEMFLMKLDRDRTQTLLQCMQCAINFYYYYDQTRMLPEANSAVVSKGVTTPPGFLAPQSVNTNARDQERFFMEQKNYQTQLLLFSMQNLINTYNGVNTITTPPAGFLMPQSINTDTTTGNVSTPMGVFDLPELANLTDDDLLENISFTHNDLQADFPLVDDDLKTFGDIFIGPDSPGEGVDFHPTPNHLKDSVLDSPWEGVDFHPTPNHLKDNASRPSHECKSQQVISELPSAVTKVLFEKDMNIQGPDSLTAMKSIKNRTTNLNSKRNRQHNFGKENC